MTNGSVNTHHWRAKLEIRPGILPSILAENPVVLEDDVDEPDHHERVEYP